MILDLYPIKDREENRNTYNQNDSKQSTPMETLLTVVFGVSSILFSVGAFWLLVELSSQI